MIGIVLDVRLLSHSVWQYNPGFGTIHQCHAHVVLPDDDERSAAFLRPIAFRVCYSIRRRMVPMEKRLRRSLRSRIVELNEG